ncbi:glycosyltransferase family 4 protein [Nitrospira defluvii]|nr:glycosyltransferase family 4 protein [Nitrospira defluvii]
MFRSTKVLSATDVVFAIIHDKGRIKAAFEKEGRPFLTQETRFRLFPIIAARGIAAIIDRCQIEVMHVHWGKDLALAALAKWFSKKKPRLVYTRQMKMTRSKNNVYHNFLYGQMDLMLTITDKLAGEAKGFLNPKYAQKVVRLYYGVEVPTRFMDEDKRRKLRRALGIDEEVFLVGLFGRIEEVKGQYLLVDALWRAKAEGIPMSGLIVGHAMKEDYLQELKHRVTQRNLNQKIIFKDFVDHPQDWMQICDCIVLATHEETFGLVLVEAMRAGVPVIGSDRGGVPEIIDHEKTGLLFESANSEHLYRCLARLKKDRVFRENMALAGKQKADELFSSVVHFRMLRKFMEG